MPVTEFDLAAVALILLSLHFHMRQRRVSGGGTPLLGIILVFILASSLTSLLRSATLFRSTAYGSLWSSTASTLFFLVSSTIPPLTAWYGIGNNRPKLIGERLLFLLPWASALFLLLLNPFTGILFTVAESGIIQRTGCFFLLNLFATLYLLYLMAVLSFSRQSRRHGEKRIWLIILSLPVAAIIVQQVFPDLILVNLSAALAAMLMQMTLEKRRDLTGYAEGLLNRDAFIRILTDLFASQKRFRIIAIHAEELKRFKGFFDRMTYNRIVTAWCSWLKQAAGRDTPVFMLEEGLFVVINRQGVRGDSAGDLALEIIKRAGEVWGFDPLRVEIPVNLAMIQCPQDCFGVPDVFDRIEQLTDLPVHSAGRHIFYASDFTPDKRRREAAIALALKQAVDKGSLGVYYQPIYSVTNRTPIAVEALAGLVLDDGELIRQGELIRIARQTGLVSRIGELMLKESCRWFVAEELPARGIGQLQIRLFEAFCLEADWPQTVLRIIKEQNIEPSRLCLELTEASVVHADRTLEINMQLITGFGIPFALDDYGSGYSDLGKVLSLPFPLVKLDKKIIHTGLKCDRGRKLLAGTVNLFRNLGRAVVAEGIETAEQERILTAMGCDHLQGFRFGHPEPAAVVIHHFPLPNAGSEGLPAGSA